MNFHLNPHTILPILCTLLSIICGIFVIIQNPKAKLNRLFFAVCITIAAWFSFYIPFNFNSSEYLVIKWIKISYCFISFIPITTFTFITTYLETPRNNFWFKINTLIGLTFAILSITSDLIIQGIYHYTWYPYPKAGILHLFLIIHCMYLSYFSIKLTTKELKNPYLPTKKRNHIKYMLSAIIALSFGILDFIGNYGVNFYEIGFIPASAYLIITSIAIIKHQLMDIQIVIRKSLVYSILVSLITLIFLVLILVTEKISQSYLGYHQNLINSIMLSIIIAIIFIPLRNKIQNLVERLFFKGTTVEIAQQNELLRQEVLQTERLKAVSTLASGMAHEIKNPLTVIKTFSEYLPQRMHDEEFLKKFTPIIAQEVDRINNLVHELLDFSKPALPVFKEIHIHDLLNKTLELLSNEAIKHNIKITTDFKLDNNTILMLDYNQIRQALLNILLNAIDAMPNGGQLTVSTYTSEENHKLNIKIQDTGIGIVPEDLKHIFDPFFSKKDNGTGLGLAITHEIIRQHGGKILVESIKGNGTAFILEFDLNKGIA